MALAVITWYKENQGGRKTIPPIGAKIYPTIRFEGENEIVPWSLWLINKEINSQTESLAEINFLMKNAPFDLLQIRKNFSLYEGARKIADGIIKITT